MDELGLTDSSSEDLFMYFKEGDTVSNLEYIDQIHIDVIDEVKRSRIFHTQFLRSSIEEVSEKFSVPSNLIKKWIKVFIENLKLRKSANKNFFELIEAYSGCTQDIFIKTLKLFIFKTMHFE